MALPESFEHERILKELHIIRNDATDAYSQNKLSETHYTILKEMVSEYSEDMFMKNIIYIYNNVRQDNSNFHENLSKLRSSIIFVYARGIVNETHYTILRERISEYFKE